MDSLTWRERLAQARNRLFASPAFQRRAARVPLVRAVARHNAAALFDLTAGFVYAQVAAAFVESGALDRLADGPLTADAVVPTLPPAAAETLLVAGEGLGLSERHGARWMLGPRGAMLRGTSGVREMIAHHRLLYADLADPLAMLRGEGPGGLAGLWSYADDADPEKVAAYSRLMAASNAMVAEQALAAYDFGRHRRMLDVGGGEGRFIGHVAERHPALGFGLFDRPAVVDRVTDSRVAKHPGSFLTDALPAGYDLVTLVRVLHDHDDAPAAALLARVRRALAPGGHLLIVEPMAATRGAEGVGTYFAMYLAAMRSGRPRAASELVAMAKAAGFRRVVESATPQPLIARVLVASI
jgi:demethylspheroidene O-methyltransferase